MKPTIITTRYNTLIDCSCFCDDDATTAPVTPVCDRARKRKQQTFNGSDVAGIIFERLNSYIEEGDHNQNHGSCCQIHDIFGIGI